MNKSIAAIAAASLFLVGCETTEEDEGPKPYESRYQALPSGPTLLTGATVLSGAGDRLDNADVLMSDVRITSEDTPEPDRESVWIEPGDVCPVCHQGHMQLVKAYYRHRAAWDLSIAVPEFDSS